MVTQLLPPLHLSSCQKDKSSHFFSTVTHVILRKSTDEASGVDHTGWAKSTYTVIIFFFTGIVNDGRELKYRTKKVYFEAVLEN